METSSSDKQHIPDTVLLDRKRPRDSDEDSTDSPEQEQKRDAEGSSHQSMKQTQTPQLKKLCATPAAKSDFARHVEIAKPFILKSLDRRGMGRDRCVETWQSLAGTAWQEDADICSAAFECGMDPKYFEGSRILREEPQALSKMIRSADNKRQVRELWEMLNEEMRHNMCVCFAAVDRGLPYRKIPQAFMSDKNLLEGIQKKMLSWSSLPSVHKKKYDLGLSALTVSNASFDKVLDKVTDKVRLWKEWACLNPHDYYVDWIDAPEEILSDRELMLAVISKDASVIQYIGDALKHDLDFLESALEHNIECLGEIPHNVFRRFPFIMTVERIGEFKKSAEKLTNEKNDFSEAGKAHNIRSRVPDEYWSDRAFVLNWLRLGYDLHPRFSSLFQDDLEIVEVHAKNFTDWDFYIYPQGLFSDEFLSDKESLRRLLEIAPPDPIMDLVKTNPLYCDFELMLFASYKYPSYRPYASDALSRQFNFHTKIRSKLGDYERFFKGILCGTAAGSGSSLVLLDQGSDLSIKHRIASFLDFPMGETLVWLKQAAINLGIQGPYARSANEIRRDLFGDSSNSNLDEFSESSEEEIRSSSIDSDEQIRIQWDEASL